VRRKTKKAFRLILNLTRREHRFPVRPDVSQRLHRHALASRQPLRRVHNTEAPMPQLR
jgi:hypothetical protein